MADSDAITDGARLTSTERAAIAGRMDAGTATKADWLAWERELEAMLLPNLGMARG